MGLEAGIWASRLGFGPRNWDLGLDTGIWASRLGSGPRGWYLGLEAGIWASRLVLKSFFALLLIRGPLMEPLDGPSRDNNLCYCSRYQVKVSWQQTSFSNWNGAKNNKIQDLCDFWLITQFGVPGAVSRWPPLDTITFVIVPLYHIKLP